MPISKRSKVWRFAGFGNANACLTGGSKVEYDAGLMCRHYNNNCCGNLPYRAVVHAWRSGSAHRQDMERDPQLCYILNCRFSAADEEQAMIWDNFFDR